jgi:hypothetical protein
MQSNNIFSEEETNSILFLIFLAKFHKKYEKREKELRS